MRRQRWDTQRSAFEDAAVRVLKQSRRPLTVRELMKRMIDSGDSAKARLFQSDIKTSGTGEQRHQRRPRSILARRSLCGRVLLARLVLVAKLLRQLVTHRSTISQVCTH